MVPGPCRCCCGCATGVDDAEASPPTDPPPSRAAVASNWRSVLVADAAMGGVLIVIGVALIVGWDQVIAGASVAAFGFGYLLVVRRRRDTWVAWRRRNGLGT